MCRIVADSQVAGPKRWLAGLFLAGLLTACAPLPPPDGATQVTRPSTPAAVASPTQTARNFARVVLELEPAIERECMQRRTRQINCDFQFVVDDQLGLEPNAFQTVDERGRPIIGFTLSLIREARNADEIAFVVGHEASHHVLNHLDHKTSVVMTGALIVGGIAVLTGLDNADVKAAQNVGATVGSIGARYYSKSWELQADYLGAIMALNAGFDPLNGVRFFERLPDPGNRILGTHPSREARIAQVNRAIADVRSGRVR